MEQEYYCRICGLKQLFLPWGEDGKTPTYEICDCCGVEFGNEDSTLTGIKNYREKWLSEGAKWFNFKNKPKIFDIKKQMENISKKYF